MLALMVTALIAGAISGMMGAVTAGVGTRKDTRTVMIRANAAATRLSAYIAPSRCVLHADTGALVLWLEDSRQSDTAHATEVRWLLFDEDAGTIEAHLVSFPDGWSQAAQDLEDTEHAATANWLDVLQSFRDLGWTASMPIVDGLEDVSVEIDQPNPLQARHVTMDLAFETTTAAQQVMVTSTIRLHQPPLN
jgi:hypothetical protein